MSNHQGIEIDLPCGITYSIRNLVLDLNGTLTVDGRFIEGVCERLEAVSKRLDVFIVTADMHQTVQGIADSIAKKCSIKAHRLDVGRGDLQKLAFLDELGCNATATIGNGCNDALMLKASALGICILGPEGASTEALLASSLVFHNICDALDVFLKPSRLIATLRK